MTEPIHNLPDLMATARQVVREQRELRLRLIAETKDALEAGDMDRAKALLDELTEAA